MIDLASLEEFDKDRWVEYTDGVGKKERGRLKGWNEKNIFVVYKCAGLWQDYRNYTGCATNPKDLVFIKLES